MPTLTPTLTRNWLSRLTTIIETCNTSIDEATYDVGFSARVARTEAIILRDELLELTVVAVEVERV